MMDSEIQLKKCNRCKVNLQLSHFSQKRNGEYCKQCKQCNERRKEYRNNLPPEKKKEYYDNRDKDKSRATNRKYYESNKDEINAKRRETGKERYDKIKDKERERQAKRQQDPEYRQKQKERAHERYLEKTEEIKEKVNAYRLNHPEEVKKRQREWKAKKYAEDPNFKLLCCVRSRICEILREKKSKKAKEYLGCDGNELREHIEKQFKEGMNWDNYGEWHVDHIIPIKYNNPSMEEIIERLHFTNTQPLWSSDNVKKSNKFIG